MLLCQARGVTSKRYESFNLDLNVNSLVCVGAGTIENHAKNPEDWRRCVTFKFLLWQKVSWSKTKENFVVALYTLLTRWDIQTTAINMFKITHQTEALRSAINTWLSLVTFIISLIIVKWWFAIYVHVHVFDGICFHFFLPKN